jgi:hypothetical protein
MKDKSKSPGTKVITEFGEKPHIIKETIPPNATDIILPSAKEQNKRLKELYGLKTSKK